MWTHESGPAGKIKTSPILLPSSTYLLWERRFHEQTSGTNDDVKDKKDKWEKTKQETGVLGCFQEAAFFFLVT